MRLKDSNEAQREEELAVPRPQLVTFDCAGTLVEIRQPLIAAIHDAADTLAIPLTREAAQLFQAMYMGRLPEFHRINLSRDPVQGAAFWQRLAADWLRSIGGDPGMAVDLQREVDRASFGSNSSMFALFPDTLSCLERLKLRGVRMAVISNWDYTLHRVLEGLGITSYFDVVLASLEEGWEKPDPRIFEVALTKAGVEREHAIHVGDHPVDDVEGPAAAGMRGILLDRSSATPGSIQTFDELEEHPVWTS